MFLHEFLVVLCGLLAVVFVKRSAEILLGRKLVLGSAT